MITSKFRESLPPTPVGAQLVMLHSLIRSLTDEIGPTVSNFLPAAEHSLREIAVYTAEPPRYHIPPIPEKYSTEGLDPRPILMPSLPDLTRVGVAVKDAARGMQEALAGLRARRTPEQQERASERRYREKIKAEREAAHRHLRSETNRVRRELGLPPDNTKIGA